MVAAAQWHRQSTKNWRTIAGDSAQRGGGELPPPHAGELFSFFSLNFVFLISFLFRCVCLRFVCGCVFVRGVWG